MYKLKYIFGKTVKHNGENHKVVGIRFTSSEIMYKLSGIKEWISEKEI